MGEADMLTELRQACERDTAWAGLATLLDDTSLGVHIAVMVEPFLTYLLDGDKVIESRFSRNAIMPFRRISPGDLVFLKAGPVLGAFRASTTEFVELYDGEIDRIRNNYAEQICAYTDDFWHARADKRYATLIGVESVRRLPPVSIPKRDMRGWVIVRPGDRANFEQLQLM